jgi:DNA gyrase subunit B
MLMFLCYLCLLLLNVSAVARIQVAKITALSNQKGEMIESLSWHEAVRTKLGMYIGRLDEKGLTNCVTELLANSVEQHLAGLCTAITLTIHEDGSASVKDDGPGISVMPVAGHGVAFLELAFTTLNSPRRNHPYHVMGMAGVGAKCVNALSEWMIVNTCSANEEFEIAFARGKVKEPLRKVSESTVPRGTLIRFKPDVEIFNQATFSSSTLTRILQEVAMLYPGLRVHFMDQRSNSANRGLASHFHFPNGGVDYLRLLHEPEIKIHPEPIQIAGEDAGVKVSIAFQFVESMSTRILSFVNSSLSPRGGTHVAGFLRGLADAVNHFTGPRRRFQPHEIRVGLSAIVSVWLGEPKYAGAAKWELINPEVEAVVHRLSVEKIRWWIAEMQDAADTFIDQLNEQRSPGLGLG